MKLPRYLEEPYKFLKRVVQDFREDNGAIIAAAIAFYLFISLIPMLLLGVSALGFILGSVEQAQRIIFGFLQQYSPMLAQQGEEEIRSVIEDVIRGRGAIGGIGLLGLLWAGSSAFANLHKAVNIAWAAPEDRGFIKTRLLAVGMLIVVGVLLLASVAVMTGLNIIRSYEIEVFGVSPDDIPIIWNFAAHAVPLLATAAIFTLMYKIMPTRKVPWDAALLSGGMAAMFWEVARHGFSWYISNFADFSAVYGGLAGLLILVIWIYYSSLIMIISAEVGAVYGRFTERRNL